MVSPVVVPPSGVALAVRVGDEAGDAGAHVRILEAETGVGGHVLAGLDGGALAVAPWQRLALAVGRAEVAELALKVPGGAGAGIAPVPVPEGARGVQAGNAILGGGKGPRRLTRGGREASRRGAGSRAPTLILWTENWTPNLQPSEEPVNMSYWSLVQAARPGKALESDRVKVTPESSQVPAGFLHLLRRSRSETPEAGRRQQAWRAHLGSSAWVQR